MREQTQKPAKSQDSRDASVCSRGKGASELQGGEAPVQNLAVLGVVADGVDKRP